MLAHELKQPDRTGPLRCGHGLLVATRRATVGQASHGSIQIDTGKNRAPDVSIGDRGQQMPFRIDDQGQSVRVALDLSDDLPDR